MTIYYAITPIFYTLDTKASIFIKFFLFIVSVLVMLISEFWFMFKSIHVRRNLQFMWKLASPIVLSLYLIFLIICYIPEIRNVDFMKQYLTEENRNILAGGFVIYIALRRIIDDIKKRFNLNEDRVAKGKDNKLKQNEVSAEVTNPSE